MIDNTTRSIADNMIDPTHYVHGGGIQDGRLGFENVPEDWVMYVQLFVKARNRSVLLKNNEGQFVASDQQEYMVAEIPFYNKVVNKNSSGDIIPYDIQTTEYTDLFGAKGLPMNYHGTPTTLGQESAFGITNISIDFSEVLHPNIEITFVDIRGAGLASYGPTCGVTKSPYSWVFLLPFPEFCLKVKGFYGKTINIPMLLHKFNMRYNNTTGNFDITTKFSGYPFGVLNDINIKMLERLCCIPGGPEELQNVYNKLKKCLNPNNPDELIILQEMPRIEDLCIKDYIRAIESGKIDNPIQRVYSQATLSGDELIVQYNKLIKELNVVLSSVRANDGTVYASFLALLLQCKLLEIEFNTLYNTPSNQPSNTKSKAYGLGGSGGDKLVLTSTADNAVAIEIVNFENYCNFYHIPKNKFDTITLETSKSFFDPRPSDNGNIIAEKTFRDAVNHVLASADTDPEAINKTIESYITNTSFTDAMNSGNVMNGVEKCLLMLREQYQERLNYIKNYQVYLCNFFQKIEKQFKKEFTETFRTRPTLQRIITLIAINAEAFLNLLLKVSIKAEKYHEANKEKAVYTNYYTDASNQQWVNKKNTTNNGAIKLRNVKLYAWPKTYKFNSKGEKEECFPTELNNRFSEWPEVQFTKAIIDAIASNNCNHKKLIQTTDTGPGVWKPMNLFEDSPFTHNRPLNTTNPLDSPYNNVLMQRYFSSGDLFNDGTNQSTQFGSLDGAMVQEEKLKQLIVSRAFANLFYFHRLFEQNAEISDERKLTMMDGYVKLLAQRDAYNLLTTLEQCNLIETVANRLAGDVGVTNLINYVQTINALKGTNGQTFKLKPSLELPYNGIMYLGNNNINARVEDNTQTYYRPRTSQESFIEFFMSNYFDLSFYDQPQYPFTRYVTVYLNIPGHGETIISGYEYDTKYKNEVLLVANTQDVIFHYYPWYNPYAVINNEYTPPLGIVKSTINQPEYPRNVFYDKAHIVKIVEYDSFLNPSHIRDITTFNLQTQSKLPKELAYTISPMQDQSKLFEFGNGIPSWYNLFSLLTPKTKTISSGGLPIGRLAFQEYKYISPTEKKDDAIFMDGYQSVNLYESDKTYYYGVDPLIRTLSNTNRAYHTTYNYYLSDTLKSFLWDPYKTKIGNSVNKLGAQEKSAYNIATNLDNDEIKVCNITLPNGKRGAMTSSFSNNELKTESLFGSHWGEIDSYKNRNTGFQNTIFYSGIKNLPHSHANDAVLPIFYHYQEDAQLAGTNPSLLQYLFLSDTTQTTTKCIPHSSMWLQGFGETDALGVDSNGSVFTMRDLFGGTSPFNQADKYFLSYNSLISDASKGLASNSFYDIPVDMNTTWFRAKMREYNKNITPVKKYSTTASKMYSYMIWKEATARILSLCEINLLNGEQGILDSQYYVDNYTAYTTVYLVDDPTKRPGGPTTATTVSLFDDTYPQHKFINPNIDVYNGQPEYSFYGFKDDATGTYSIGTSSLDTFNGTIWPGPNGTNAFYPNDNPTENFIPGPLLTVTQPPLLTKSLSEYSGWVTQTPKWSRLFIHQTEWWKKMTNDPRLTTDLEIRAMKTYLTLMALWGANSMDALVYNYPLMSPTHGLFRVNNIDLVTLGAQLWAGDTTRYLHNGSNYPMEIILDHYVFECPILTNPALQLSFGNPSQVFPFNVVFKDTSYQLISYDRYKDYGVICIPHGMGISDKHGETLLTDGASAQQTQKWKMAWTLSSPTVAPYEITLQMFSDDVKRDLINHFLTFVETSDFARNIDSNLEALSMLREVAELALQSVENDYQDLSDFHKFPFDLEQTLLLWGDWASIVDLNISTKDFKSYYDSEDGWRVKRPEQRTVLSSKLFDMLTIETEGGHLDNPFKLVKQYDINGDVYYYSPWIRIGEQLLMLKGDIGKKIILKLLKVITLEEQNDSTIPIITKRENKYETTLDYKQKSRGKTLPGNDQNYFFEYLFKGFYFPTIYGGMKSTDDTEYDYNSLGAPKLFFTKSWRELRIPDWSSDDDLRNVVTNIINSSDRLQTYFKTFCELLNRIKTKNSNYEKCKNENKPNTSQTYNVDIGQDALLTYRTLQNLFNRWLAGSTEDDHTWKRSGCAAIVDINDKCRSLIQNIYIVDRINRPAGNKVCINPKCFSDFFNSDSDKTVMTFLSYLVSDPAGGIGGVLIEYPTFFNFGNSALNLEPNPGRSMWGMTTKVDEKYGGPAMVIYVQKSNQSSANVAINDFVSEDSGCGGSNTIPSDFHSPESRGVMFKVAIGNENNSIFTNLQIGTEEFKETYEHIQGLSQMAHEINTGVPQFLNQNLYNLWLTRSFTASLECFGNMMIQTGMYFYLENVPIFGGTYIIKQVKHSIEAHNIKTQFWGTRVNNIPSPYVTKDAIGGYYHCDNITVEDIPERIDNDPGYSKETMLAILKAFVDEINSVLGVKPLVYTSDDFLTALGFTEDDSIKFYQQYDVIIDKGGSYRPFDNVKAIAVTREDFQIRENLLIESPLSSNILTDVVAIAQNYVGQQESINNFAFYDPQFEADMKWAGWWRSAQWCGFFVRLVYKKALHEKAPSVWAQLDQLLDPHCVTMWNKCKADKSGVVTVIEGNSQPPLPGDIIVYRAYKNGVPTKNGHTGIVKSVNGTVNFRSIEGNTSTSNQEVISNGDGVFELTRNFNFNQNHGQRLLGFIRVNSVTI